MTKKLDEIISDNLGHILAENRRVTEMFIREIREHNKTMIALFEKLLRVQAVDHDYVDMVTKTLKIVKGKV